MDMFRGRITMMCLEKLDFKSNSKNSTQAIEDGKKVVKLIRQK